MDKVTGGSEGKEEGPIGRPLGPGARLQQQQLQRGEDGGPEQLQEARGRG